MTGPLTAILYAYLLASIPVGAIVLAGVVEPVYRRPARDYLRWWSWMALVFVASAFLLDVLAVWA